MISHNPEKELSKTFLATSSGDDANEGEREWKYLFHFMLSSAHKIEYLFGSQAQDDDDDDAWLVRWSK